ncbi:hypothetical protein OSB04_019979 [Centaurea solstitialis]|uniref:Retrotransposon gag domain-containing protein n=1 Tax=Centaurea solstitialis TaxID=347529 RepID=A0AA38T2T0_9ASTR|nr:hypothetical protein OSB04_019979 [Centaurea solstitialis]
MLLFNGEDVYGWVYQVERFFDVQGLVTSGERLREAMLSLEGPALSWYRRSENRESFCNWEELKRSLLSRFQSSQEGSLHNQTGTAREYVTLFEKMAAQLPRLPKEVLDEVFVKGLKPELRTVVRAHQPPGLCQAMELALVIMKVDHPGESSRARGLPLSPNKRAKGLCYRCDRKFTPGHRCPDKSLHVLLVPEEPDDEDEVLDKEEEHIHLDHVEVSAQSVMGITTPHTMKLRGSIHGFEVIVLIDSGATHNFVSVKLYWGTRETEVKLGNARFTKSVGICRGLGIHILWLVVMNDFYPLELGSADVILGIKWLRELGDTRVNWRTLTMSFQHAGKRVTLYGEPGLHRGETSLQALVRKRLEIDKGYILTLAHVGELNMQDSHVHPALDKILTEFSDVFSMPAARDHSEACTELVNVRPYRYPQLQKDEIERLVGEMVTGRIIRPSTSPYSSPVLLVKKKDGSWRFYVDYQALNKSTVLDKFPIPIIDELQDELHGATVFSKLDLKSRYH